MGSNENAIQKPAAGKGGNSKRLFVIVIAVIASYLVSFAILTHFIRDVPTEVKSINIRIGAAIYPARVVQQDSIFLKTLPGQTNDPVNISGAIYNRNPILLVWVQLILIMISIATGAFIVFFWRAKEIQNTFQLTRVQVAQPVCIAIGLCILLALIPTLMGDQLYLPVRIIEDFKILFSDYHILTATAVTTVLLTVPIIVVIFMVIPASDAIHVAADSREELDKSVSQIVILNRVLLNALQVFAVIVVFSVLTSSTLRASIKDSFVIQYFDIFPPQESYVYGLYFTSFIGIIYVPVQAFLRQRNYELNKALVAFHNTQEIKDDKWFQASVSSLDINSSSLDNLKLIFTVLSPLITSFLPQILKLT